MRKRPRKDIIAACWFLAVSLILVCTSWWAWHVYVSTPPYVDPVKFPVRGFDISAHNGYANLQAAADAGYKFVFIKASEGVSFRDENFVLNYNKARHAGLKTGAYHFFRFDRDGVEQAKHFLKVVGARPLELGLAIDIEDTGNATGVPIDSINDRLERMVEYLNLRGYRVTFYSNRAGYEKYLMDRYPGFPLWVCQFSDNSTNTDWTYWQYDHHGRIPGINGDVDLNAYFGTEI